MQPQNASQICISSSPRKSQHKHFIREEKGNKSFRLIVYEGKKKKKKKSLSACQSFDNPPLKSPNP